MNITLNDLVEPDSAAEGFWVDAHRVTVRAGNSVSTYALPKGSRRVTVSRLGNGRSQLILGGFKSVTVAVTGPSPTISQLRESVL